MPSFRATLRRSRVPKLGVLIVLFALAAAPAAQATPLKAGRPHVRPALPGSRAIHALGAYEHSLIELDRARGRLAVSTLRRNGAVLISGRLAIWRLSSEAARRLLPQLVRDGLVRAAGPDRPLQPLGHISAGDPLIPDQWWLSAVGATAVEPPGPGKPVTVIDSGLDLSHPEFSGRPNTTALNAQTLTGGGSEFHGTAVSSLVGAPANGVGIVGVYPQAVLRSWDAGQPSLSDVLAGIEAAIDGGPGVINLSLSFGGFDPLLEDAVFVAFGTGSIVVAAAGNERERGSPATFPASLNHVLTVAATDAGNVVSGFSSASLGIDLAAPGQDIPAAIPTFIEPFGYGLVDGTSFSAPIVSGATAWVWTARPDLDNTQVFDLMRFSARDLGVSRFDVDTGFGLLDIPRALTAPAPASDQQEPNDDIDHVKANGLFEKAARPLTAPGRPRGSLRARLDLAEDPEDVYRVWVPGGRGVKIRVAGDGDVNAELWDPATPSVHVTGAARRRHLIDGSYNRGNKPEQLSAFNRGRRGAFVYLDVFLVQGGPVALDYAVNVTTVRR